MKKSHSQKSRYVSCIAFLIAFLAATAIWAEASMQIRDSRGKIVSLQAPATKVICSGAGCLRLLTYLGAQNLAVAVEDIEHRTNNRSRPYRLSHPQFANLPLFGEFRGLANAERILTIEPQPQIILKTYGSMGHDPDELAQKTGLPVIVMEYGDLNRNRQSLYQTLRIMAQCIGKTERAKEIIAFFEAHITDLQQRTATIAKNNRKHAYIGGVSFKGPHGYQSTEPGYPPFVFVNAANVAYTEHMGTKQLAHSDIAKEKLLEWNPDVLFLDLGSMELGKNVGGLHELQTDPVYQHLSAVQQGKVYGLLPYNAYTQNFGSVLANAYFIGKLLYPQQFTDIDPDRKAEEIYTFLLGTPVFEKIKPSYGGLVFESVLPVLPAQPE
jgi:iron complex transport system substrate-binding protein